MNDNQQFEYQLFKPLINEVNQITKHIFDHFDLDTKNISIKNYKKYKYTINFRDRKISFEELTKHIQDFRGIDVKSSKYPAFECLWLDSEANSATNSSAISISCTLPYCDNFPIKPRIKNGNGTIYTSFQKSIQSNIIKLHRQLVDNSNNMYEINGNWISDFRMLINECVSIIDITFNQLYIFAEYMDPMVRDIKGWKFDREKLGKRENRRLLDKLSWIGLITGIGLDNAEKEIKSFTILKDLRNHLNHFDPPCFTYTIVDVANWLNLVPDVGRLLWKIRIKLKAQLCSGVIGIICLPVVIAKNSKGEIISNQSTETGYATCTWNK